MTLRMHVLGHWALYRDDALVVLPTRKARALLACLVLEPGRPQARDTLAARLWSGSAPVQARSSLRQALFEIRKALGPDAGAALVVQGAEIRLDLARIETDLDRLCAQIAAPRQIADAADAIAALDRLLPDFDTIDAEFAIWLGAARATTRARIEAQLAAIYRDPGAGVLHRLTAAQYAYRLDEFDEEAARAVMEGYVRTGRAPAAIRVYDALYARLDEDLDIEPSLQTQDLAVRIKTQDLGGDMRPQTSAPTAAQRTLSDAVAILPFDRLGGRPDDGLGALGLLEEMTCILAGLSSPPVVSSNSTRQYLGSTPSAQTVQADLGVRYVLCGSVRAAGGSTTVSAQLVEAATGTIVAARLLDYPGEDALLRPTRIARDIVKIVVPSLHAAELSRTRAIPTEAQEPYHLYLRAREQFLALTPESQTRARQLLDMALDRDPGFAPAHTLMAEWHSLSIWQGWTRDRAASEAALEDSAHRAAALSSNEGRALALLGHNRVILHRRYDEAEALFQRALDTLPNDAETLIWTVPSYAYVGQAARAVANGEKALRLSPRDPLLFRNQHFLGIAHYALGEVARAVELGLACYRRAPRYTSNLRMTLAALAAQGQTDAGMLRAHAALEPGFSVRGFMQAQAFRDPDQRTRYADHLLRAGLPA